MRVELADEAEADLEAIAMFIAQDSPQQALQFVVDLREACERLADSPRRFPVVRGQLRKALHGNYLIFLEARQETIYVIHIFHGATDYEPRLGLA